MKKILTVFAALALTLTLASCDDSVPSGDEVIHVTSVEVDESAKNLVLEVDETFTFGTRCVTVLPEDATNKSYTLSSSDTSVFTTSGYVITGIGEGSATLTVTTTDGGFTDTASVTVVGIGGDENPDTGGEGGGGEPDTGGGEPEQDKDVTITTDPTSITVKGGESAAFTVSVTEGAAVQSVTSDNAAVTVTGSDTEYTVSGTNNTDYDITATITITAGGEGFKTASTTLPVTVTPADEYTYELVVANEDSIPTTGWYYNSEDTFTFEPQLKVLNRGDLEETITLSASEAEVTVTNDDGTAEDIIAVSGLTISPKGGAGTVTATVAYTGSITEAVGKSKSYTITVDDIITSTHTITLAEDCVPSEITVGETGFDISATLTTETTTGSTGKTTTTSVAAQASDLSISCNPSDAFTIAGLHLVPTAVEEDTPVTITVVWSEYSSESTATATASITIHPKEDAVYTMEITNASAFDNWYVGDDPITITYTVTSSEEDENPVSVPAEEISVTIDNTEVVTKDGLTLTPVGQGTASVFIQWTEHTEANATLEITVGEHWYTLTITNEEEFSADWSIEEGARTLAITLESDREDVDTNVSSSTVELDYVEGAFTVNAASGGFSIVPTLTAAETGECTITATWIGHESATQSISVNVNNNIAVDTLTLNETDVNLSGTDDSATLTAALYGKDGVSTPTNTEVLWESNNTNVIVTPDSNDSRTAVVTASDYDQQATITATAAGNSNATASCTVTVAAAPAVSAKLVKEALTPSIVSSPDDHGVYVLGDSTGTSYLDSSFSITNDYDGAVGIKTIATETTGEYYLQVGDKYIDNNLSATDTEPTTVFTISGSGIAMSTNTIYIDSNGLSTSSGSAAYLLDTSFVETTTTTTEGEHYLHGSHSGQEYFYNGTADSSSRLSGSLDMNDAVKVTLTHVSGNAYYMQYGSTWIVPDDSSAKATATTATLIYYDATNDAWCNAAQTKYLGANTGSSGGNTTYFFGSYAYSNLNQYEAVTLYDSDNIPEIKGIGITLTDTTFEVGESTAASLKTYPSSAHTLEFSDLEFSCTGSGTASFNSDSHMISGVTEGSTTITFTYGSVSDSHDIEITGNTSGTKTLTFSHTFVNGDFGTTGTAAEYTGGSGYTLTNDTSGLTWTTSDAVRLSYSSGLAVGSNNYPQNTDPFTFTTNFGEEVTLTDVMIELKVNSSGGATYNVYLDSTTALTGSSSATDYTKYSGTGLELVGSELQFSIISTKSKGLQINSFSFTIVVDANSNLSF